MIIMVLIFMIIITVIVVFLLYFKFKCYVWKASALLIIIKVRIILHMNKSLKQLIRTAIDFIIFFFVFLWKEGCVWDWILSKISHVNIWIEKLFKYFQLGLYVTVSFFQQVIEQIIFLTPFGRAEAENPNFQYALIICTICTVIGLIANIEEITDEFPDTIVCDVILSVVLSIGMWYGCFGVCHWIVKISVFYHILAFIAAVFSSFIVWIVVMFIFWGCICLIEAL